MANLFADIEDQKDLDKLLFEMRAAYRLTVEARNTAKDIITRKIRQPEWIRTVNRKLFPQLQQLALDLQETIVLVKEQRSNVQRNSGKPQHDPRPNDDSSVAGSSADN